MATPQIKNYEEIITDISTKNWVNSTDHIKFNNLKAN